MSRNLELPIPQPKSVLQTLFLCIAVLVTLSSIGQIAKYGYGHGWLFGFVPLFYVDAEANAPAWFSSMMLFMSSVLLLTIYRVKKQSLSPYTKHWLAMGLIFAFLSLDEAAKIHEYPIEPLRNALDAGGILYYTWVIPGALFVLVFCIAYARFLLDLPRGMMFLFILSGALFVAGAIGIEMATGAVTEKYSAESPQYAAVATLEELCEMSGIAIFIYSLLKYLRRYVTAIQLLEIK